MKKNKKKLNFKKSDIVELNNNKLNSINGGANPNETGITSSIGCITEALSIKGPIDPNGSSNIC